MASPRSTDPKAAAPADDNAGDKAPPHPLGSPRAPRSGPVTKSKVSEGASLGKSANSPAGGAAGQLTPKD